MKSYVTRTLTGRTSFKHWKSIISSWWPQQISFKIAGLAWCYSLNIDEHLWREHLWRSPPRNFVQHITDGRSWFSPWQIDKYWIGPRSHWKMLLFEYIFLVWKSKFCVTSSPFEATAGRKIHVFWKWCHVDILFFETRYFVSHRLPFETTTYNCLYKMHISAVRNSSVHTIRFSIRSFPERLRR